MVCSAMGDELVYIAWNSHMLQLQCMKTYNILLGFLLLASPKMVCMLHITENTLLCLSAFPTATCMKRATEKFRM